MRGGVGPLPRTIVTGLWVLSAGTYQPRGPDLKQTLMPYGKVPAVERKADIRHGPKVRLLPPEFPLDMTFDAPTAQLLSALLGGALAIAGAIGAQWALDAHRRRAERRGLAGAFAGELAALFSAMQQRRWRDRIDDLIAETERTGKVPGVVFSVRHHYFRVFDANAGRLGVLDPPLPEMLAHHYIYSKMFLETGWAVSSSGVYMWLATARARIRGRPFTVCL